jgi:hypothetical protein
LDGALSGYKIGGMIVIYQSFIHREEFPLKLFFTHETTEDQIEHHCNQRLLELKELHSGYKKIEKILKQDLPKKLIG